MLGNIWKFLIWLSFTSLSFRKKWLKLIPFWSSYVWYRGVDVSHRSGKKQQLSTVVSCQQHHTHWSPQIGNSCKYICVKYFLQRFYLDFILIQKKLKVWLTSDIFLKKIWYFADHGFWSNELLDCPISIWFNTTNTKLFVPRYIITIATTFA